jgi:carbamoyltransferase
MNIIGLSAFYHDASCCLLQDGRLAAAVSEERFSRVKHDPRLPVAAFRYCLDVAGLSVSDVDVVAYYERPEKKLERQLWAGFPTGQAAEAEAAVRANALLPEMAIRERLGFEGPIMFYDHHLSHAASAYYYSSFRDAAVLTIDGVGEWATTTYGTGRGAELELWEEVHFPHSLGLLYATLTAYLGFRVNDGEYKVMGLAAYGRPRYVDQLSRLVGSTENGQYRLDVRYFDFVQGERMFSEALAVLLGWPPRAPESPIEPFHEDVAASIQFILEEIVLEKVRYLRTQVDSPNLCLAGGVALNCVANGRIRREGPFERVFIQPAAGDAGGCLGAAALAHKELTGERPSQTGPFAEPLQDVFLGPEYSNDDIARLISATGLAAFDYRGREAELLEAVAERLAANKVVGWFQGRMEFGPRALGARSILANPMDPEMQARLNERVKRREGFRPFAPSVLAEKAADHFDLTAPSPFMLETCRVTSGLDLPAVTHVDGTARPQTVDSAINPRFASLIEAFYRRTNCPILLNTSFNVRGEAIVCTPVDALFGMVRANLDVLVLGDFLIDRTMLPDNWEAFFRAWQGDGRRVHDKKQSALRENLYTFV